MHKKYKPYQIGNNFDAIVIGSGLGGLTTACLLARAGKKVLVLEKHYVPGGFTHAFKRKNFSWDVGVHYVGQVHNHNSTLRKAFDFLTDSKLKWAEMGEIYDKSIIAGKEYCYISGVENQIENLIKSFPEEENAIRTYYKSLLDVSRQTGKFFGEKAMPPFLSKWLGRFLRKGFYRFSDTTTYDYLKTLTNNEELIAVLCAQCGDYGLPPKRSSFAVHALIVEHYLNGANYPVGGAPEICRHIIDYIREKGGEVLIRAAVKEIIVRNNQAIGVLMEDGEQLFAKKIVSNAGARNTFEKLLPSIQLPIEKMKADLELVQPSVAHLCLYVGLNKSAEELNLPKWNYWIYKSNFIDDDFETHMQDMETEPPLYYISFPSAKDPNWTKLNGSSATVQIVVACNYERIKQWEESRWMHRGESYLQFKEIFSKKLLNKLIELLPQVEPHIVLSELSTPLSTKHFSNYSKGEIYGLEHSPARFRLNWLRPQTPVKNLYLTGQDTVTVGVGGALFSGVLTASTMLKKNFLSKIENYKSPEDQVS